MQKTITILTIVMIAGSHPAAAAWHSQSDQLPGLVSGKSIAITAAIGGGAVTALILFKKLHHKDAVTSLDVPAKLNIEGSEATLVLRNRGRNVISLTEADFKGRGFEFTTPLKLPVLVRANNGAEIPIRMTGAGTAQLELTYIEDGKRHTRTVTLRGGSPGRAAMAANEPKGGRN
jgi:hypothetical protein